MTYVTRKTNAGFELQITKISGSNYARIMLGDKCAARFTSAPLAIGLRELYARFAAFDFTNIMQDEQKQRDLQNLAPTERPEYYV